ncbi:MAG: D-alanyl-D-alanine carboxypeptidase/D-alanyl-D-alanine-endopeptidase [Acidobacteria bacterium]|nr:D-alanyl-D-alanine carboxypeptidase/D-alanyl-D-alanine-endopeptidase [Acidobacteriota bacterium]
MKPLLLALFCLSAAVAEPPRQKRKRMRPLAQRMEQIIAATPALERSHVGVRVVDLKGRVLFEKNARSWFIPASNTKLYSTAFALARLGEGHKFLTRVTAQGSWGADGVLRGDLRLTGGGDPSLSGRTYPYDKRKEWDDVAPGIEALADQIFATGIRRIEGRVIGDDTAYVWDPFPNGWSIDDPLFEYGAPVSALTLQDNSLRLVVRPGAREGDPAEVSLSPDVGQFILIPDVRTEAAGVRTRVRVERPAHTRELRVHGVIAAGGRPYENLFAVEDPALYAARALEAALLRRGVTATEGTGVRHRASEDESLEGGGEVVAQWESRPLREIVQVVNKVSQNLHAEILLREGARKNKGVIARESAVDALRDFLTGEVKLEKDDVNFEDGSGLSRLTLLTPEATTKLLLHMSASPHKEAWFASLPIGGEDGTLSRRFNGSAMASRVRAKTGTLSHVSALGGYLDHPRLGTLAFTVLVNNYNSPSAEARAGIDKLVMTLLE